MFGLAAGGERFVPSFYIDSSMKIGEYCGTKGKMIYEKREDVSESARNFISG